MKMIRIRCSLENSYLGPGTTRGELSRDRICGRNFASTYGVTTGHAFVFVDLSIGQDQQQSLADRLSAAALLAEER
jgi:hypothetical protein